MRTRIRTEALLVRSAPFGDADLMVTLFTEARGSVTAVARSARRSARRFPALEPMHLLRVGLEERPGVELASLAESAIVRPRLGIMEDLVHLVAAGAALRLSWRPAGLVLQFFFLGNVLPMMTVVGTLYVESPLRLCNAYLLDDQVRLGEWLIGAAAAVAVMWLAWVAWVMVRREAQAQLGAASRAPR